MIHYLLATIAVGLSTIPQTIWTLSKVLPVRSSIHKITALAAFKLIIYSFLVDYLLRQQYAGTVWWHLLWLLLGTSIPVAMYLMFIHVFDGQLIKRVMIPIIVETVAELPAMLGLSLANMLAAGEFQPDLMSNLGAYIVLIPVCGFGLFAIIWKMLGRQLKKLCAKQFHHAGLLWAVALLYLLASIVSFWGDVMAAEEWFLLVGMIPNIILIIWLIAILVRSGTISGRELEHRAKMDAIRRALDTEYENRLTEQEEIIVKNRGYIEQNLKQISRKGDVAEAYYNELIKAYRDIDAGIYSKNRLLDAVISREVRSLKAKGVKSAISIEEAELFGHKEEVLLELLLLLFEEAENGASGGDVGKIENVGRCTLSVTQPAGRCRVEFTVSKGVFGRPAVRYIKKIVNAEQGAVNVRNSNGAASVELFF